MAKILTPAIIFLILQSASAQPYDVSLIEEEIADFYSEYVSAFTSQQSELLADNFLIAPIYIRNGPSTVFLQNREDVLSYLNSVYSDLSNQSYATSKVLVTNICVLTDTSALVSVGFQRFNSDGNVILESGATYSIFKIDDNWRFTMSSTHDVENIISCGN